MMKRIAIHSVPRSGSTWLGQILNSSPSVNYNYQPLFSYAFKDRLNLKSTKDDVLSFFNEIAKSDDEFINSSNPIDNERTPIFKKNNNYEFIVYKEVRYHHLLKHLMEIDTGLIVIGLVRNPKSVINSWFNAPKEFKIDLNWKKENEWLNAPLKNNGYPENFYGFNKWLECTQIFYYLKNKYPNRFMIVNYDDLLMNTEKVCQEVFRFCGIKFEQQTGEFLIESRTKNESYLYSVFNSKKNDDDWKTKLDASIVKGINERLKEYNLELYI